jgi:hypothetical protein
VLGPAGSAFCCCCCCWVREDASGRVAALQLARSDSCHLLLLLLLLLAVEVSVLVVELCCAGVAGVVGGVGCSTRHLHSAGCSM